MIKNVNKLTCVRRLTALTFSCILTVGLVAASAPAVQTTTTAESEFNLKIDRMAEDCSAAFWAWKFYRDNGKRLNEIVETYPDNEKPMVLLVCRGYGEGFEDGRKMT